MTTGVANVTSTYDITYTRLSEGYVIPDMEIGITYTRVSANNLVTTGSLTAGLINPDPRPNM